MPERQRLLELALKGLEADRAKLDDEIAEIKRELNHRPPLVKGAAVGNTPSTTQPKKKRRMSAAAKRKISEAMKRRYAAMRAAKK